MNESNQSSDFECFYCGGILPKHLDRWECPHCGKPLAIKRIPDPQTQCGNCHERLEPEDRHCRFCGTKRGEGAYDPYPEMFVVEEIYGPMPIGRTHICKQCGYSWSTCQMIDKEGYCPKCGGEAPYPDYYYWL